MLEQFCDDFLAVVPLQLPELLDKRKMEKPVKYDDYVLLTFQLNTPFTRWSTCRQMYASTSVCIARTGSSNT